ncbi:MAG: hypothetical protein ACR2RF_09960 [Geminicoccaceae bacterium]
MADKDYSLNDEDWECLMVAWSKLADQENVPSGDMGAMVGLLRTHWGLLTDIKWVRKQVNE